MPRRINEFEWHTSCALLSQNDHAKSAAELTGLTRNFNVYAARTEDTRAERKIPSVLAVVYSTKGPISFPTHCH